MNRFSYPSDDPAQAFLSGIEFDKNTQQFRLHYNPFVGGEEGLYYIYFMGTPYCKDGVFANRPPDDDIQVFRSLSAAQKELIRLAQTMESLLWEEHRLTSFGSIELSIEALSSRYGLEPNDPEFNAWFVRHEKN